jgi:hypothetical protein
MSTAAQPASQAPNALQQVLKSESAIESFTKAGAIVLALAYAIGLIVANLYLFQFGDSDYNLLRVRCVFTGFVVLLLGAGGVVTLLCLRISGVVRNAVTGGETHLSRLRLLGKLFLGIVAGMAWTGTLARLVLPDTRTLIAVWHSVAVMYLCAAALGGLVMFGVREHESRHYLRRIIVLCAIVAISLTCLKTFADRVYPQIADNMGGGRRKYEQILPTSEGIRYLRALGFHFNKDNCTTKVLVRYENEDHMALEPLESTDKLTPTGVILLDRKLIAARIYDATENGRNALHLTEIVSWAPQPCSLP